MSGAVPIRLHLTCSTLHDPNQLNLTTLLLSQGKDVRLTQTAVQMVNFVHNTTLSLQYPPQTIGLGVLFFTLKQLNCEVWHLMPHTSAITES